MKTYTLRPFLKLIGIGFLTLISYSLAYAGDAPPVYTPPVVDAPGTTVGGGTRGHESVEDDQFLSVLATQTHVGQTISAQPVLYWVLTHDMESSIMVSLSNMDAAMQTGKPLLGIEVAHPKAGIYKVDLAKHQVILEPGVEYAWGVEALVDEQFPSRNPSSMATLVRIQPQLKVAEALAKTNELEHPAIYAQAGLWYDAFDALSRLIDKYPGKATELHQYRSDLLRQIGLQ